MLFCLKKTLTNGLIIQRFYFFLWKEHIKEYWKNNTSSWSPVDQFRPFSLLFQTIDCCPRDVSLNPALSQDTCFSLPLIDVCHIQGDNVISHFTRTTKIADFFILGFASNLFHYRSRHECLYLSILWKDSYRISSGLPSVPWIFLDTFSIYAPGTYDQSKLDRYSASSLTPPPWW